MNNNHESMPNQVPEPKKPEFSEDDIDALVESFEEGRSEKERAESAASIESMIAETIKELDAQEARREAEKAAEEKSGRVERTGIVYGEAPKIAAETMRDNLAMALQMADTPEGAVLLVNPVHERLQKILDPHGGFSKLHDDPRIQELYRVYTDKIRHEAVMAVKTRLEKELDSETDPERISGLHKLLEAVEASDPGGDKE
jgi:hypothetical protein